MEQLLYIESPFTTGRYRGQRPQLAVADAQTRAEYLRGLCRVVQALPADARFSAVRMGGISSVLRSDELAHMLAQLRNAHCAPDAELTLTVAPDTITSPYLSAMAAAGYTRLEVPVLTLSERLLAQNGTDWRLESIEDALQMLADYACPNVGVKLWCGLNGQTEGQLRDAMFTCAALPGVRHIRLLQPDGENEAQYRFCAEWLAGAGFSEYAPGRFARAGGEEKYYLLRAAGAKVIVLDPESV